MGTITIEQSHSSMAKVLCILAWAGLVTAAPYYHDRREGSSVDAEQIVNTVMKSLDLNQVIAQAMKGLSGSGSSFTGTFTQLPQSTLKISGSSVGENSLGRYAGVSTSGGSRFSLQSSNSGFSGSRSGSTSADTNHNSVSEDGHFFRTIIFSQPAVFYELFIPDFWVFIWCSAICSSWS